MKTKQLTLKKMTNQELWDLFPIILTKHKKIWSTRYQKESRAIMTAVGAENIQRISHIGSTSIDGLIAKPTIDILLEITDICDVKKLTSALCDIGYLYSKKPENPPPHMMFMKGYTNEGFKGQAFHLHVRYLEDWNELYFRDYLKIHSKIASAYGNLKMGLKEKFEHDRDAYTDSKSEFILKYTQRAREEFPDRYKPK